MDRHLYEEIMNQPPFNPLQELAEDTSGITFRAKDRLRKWMEYHNEAYERETCPVGGCDGPSCSSFACDEAVNPLPNQSNEIKTLGDAIVWQKSKDYMAECKIEWNIVRERMNQWMVDTQNPECHHVFFAYNESVCNAMAKQDCPPKVDEDLAKYHNLGDGWHGFSYTVENEDHIGEINKMLLDKAWMFICGQESVDGSFDIGIKALEFGRSTNYKRGVVSPFEGDAYIKFKIIRV